MIAYLACVVIFPLSGPPKDGASTYVLMAAPWIGAGCGLSMRLQGKRRRDGGGHQR